MRRINPLNEYAVLDRKLDKPYPMEVDTPYQVKGGFQPERLARYREYDLAHLKLVFEFSIYTVWKSVRYGISNGLDTAYWGFLGARTTLDIFQNLHIIYLQYVVLVFSRYGVLTVFPSWSLVSAGTDMPYIP
ncbi:hypothetical protein Tco_0092573 [Tanacetum coccineum]